MKKILFLLLVAKISHAQIDSLPKQFADSNFYNASVFITDHEVSLSDVFVSSTRADFNTPTTFKFVTKAELNKNNLGQDLPFLLDNTPSVVTTSDAGAGIGYTGIRIRGSDATRINVTLNGIPVNDAESQGMYWVDLPDVVSSAQNIQIQRGVGASTNGGSAFGGTLSVQTQTPSEKPFGEMNISGGSFATFKINGKAGTGIHKGFFAEASGSWITSEGYIDRASSNLKSWFAQTGYMHNNTLLKLLYFGGREKTYQAWNGLPQDSLKSNRTFNDLGTDYGQHFPPYKNQTDNYGQDYFQLLLSQQLPKNTSMNVGAFATLGRGYYEEYKVAQTFNNYFENHDTVETYTDLVRQKWLKNIFYGGTFALNFERSNFSGVFGGLFGQYRGENFGKVIWAQDFFGFDKNAKYYDGHSVKNDINVYAKFNYEILQKLNFYLDLQYRYVGYTAIGIDGGKMNYDFSRQWHFFNPKAGILYKIKAGHSLYASYANGNREPNRDDVLAALASNKTVKPEMLHDAEAGYKFGHSKFPLIINFYFMLYKNQLVLTGRLNDVGNPVKENVPSSFRTGVELNGSIHYDCDCNNSVEDIFIMNYSFTYSLHKIKSFNEYVYTYDDNYTPVDSFTQIITHINSNISFSPDIVASLELQVHPFRGAEISLTAKAVSKQYLDNTSNEARKLKPFFYTNLRVSYKLPLKRDDKEIMFTLLLNNFLNVKFESNGYTYSERYYAGGNLTDTYTYNYYYPQAGANVLAGVHVKF